MAAHKVNSSLKHMNRNVRATKNASIPPELEITHGTITRCDSILQLLEHKSQPNDRQCLQKVGNCDPGCKQSGQFSEAYKKAAAVGNTFLCHDKHQHILVAVEKMQPKAQSLLHLKQEHCSDQILLEWRAMGHLVAFMHHKRQLMR
jgi:hypothetical protein